MEKRHHVGFIVRSPSYTRVGELLEEYARRAQNDFNAFMPARESPTD